MFVVYAFMSSGVLNFYFIFISPGLLDGADLAYYITYVSKFRFDIYVELTT